MTEPAWHH